MEYTPVLTTGNTKFAAGYATIAEKLWSCIDVKLDQDCAFGRSNSTYDIIRYQAALLYVHLIYLDIVDEYATVLTLAEYKVKYDYESNITKFKKHGISLELIFDAYDFQTLIDSL